jgi:hypothetical protein
LACSGSADAAVIAGNTVFIGQLLARDQLCNLN